MYSTCLFCNRPLGKNELVENFPVGRRLAYDPAKGRLWVVCTLCERWNLTPLDTRWEAIEEAERLYRGAKLKVATDNVGLAQFTEGLELVRLGSPPRLELAAWRYGDQFGRRRRKKILLTVASPLVTVSPFLISRVGVGLAVAGSGLVILYSAADMYRTWSEGRHRKYVVHDNDGDAIALTHREVGSATLIPDGGYGYWYLRLRHRDTFAILHGSVAQRALAKLLPTLNRDGGSAKRVREAVNVIGESKSVESLLHLASINAEAKRTHLRIVDGESNVGALPPRLRLALEMAMHEDDERRAMEGALNELEARWREAEEIATIADGLTLPTGIDEELKKLRQRAELEPRAH